jgi:hypothetical protein
VAPAETGELTKGLIATGEQLHTEKNEEFRTDVLNWFIAYFEKETGRRVQTVSLAERAAADQKFALRLRRTLEGIRFLRTMLIAVKGEVEAKSFLPTRCRNLLVDVLGMEVTPVVADTDEFRDPDMRQFLLQFIDGQLQELDSLLELRTASIRAENHASLSSCNLPPSDAMDRIVRYETHLTRELNNAMLHLERIQRRRQGESVTAPLRLQIDRG